MQESRSIKNVLSNIERYVNKNQENFEPEHGYQHHFQVAKDALRIARNYHKRTGVDIDLNSLMIACCVHDISHRGNCTQDEINTVLINSGVVEDKLEKIHDIASTHSYDSKPNTIEGKILWVADKINYVDPDRFASQAEKLRLLSDDERQRVVADLEDKYVEKWLRAVNQIPNHPIIKDFPDAIDIFNARLLETLNFFRIESFDIYEPVVTAYDALQKND